MKQGVFPKPLAFGPDPYKIYLAKVHTPSYNQDDQAVQMAVQPCMIVVLSTYHQPNIVTERGVCLTLSPDTISHSES